MQSTQWRQYQKIEKAHSHAQKIDGSALLPRTAATSQVMKFEILLSKMVEEIKANASRLLDVLAQGSIVGVMTTAIYIGIYSEKISTAKEEIRELRADLAVMSASKVSVAAMQTEVVNLKEDLRSVKEDVRAILQELREKQRR